PARFGDREATYGEPHGREEPDAGAGEANVPRERAAELSLDERVNAGRREEDRQRRPRRGDERDERDGDPEQKAFGTAVSFRRRVHAGGIVPQADVEGARPTARRRAPARRPGRATAWYSLL